MELGKQKMRPRHRSQGTTFAVFIVGILLVALGITYQAATSSNARQATVYDQIIFGILLAVGGGVIGASINTFVVRRFEGDALLEVREVISRSLAARFISEDRELEAYRQLWHHYYVTQVEGSTCWWYEKQSLVHNSTIGSLSGQSVLLDSAGNAHSYLTELGVRGNRLILISARQDGAESASIAVFPTPRGFQKLHTGILVLETWDSSQMLTKIIISQSPLIENIPEGRLFGEHPAILDRIWSDNFSRTVHIELNGPS